MYVNEAELVSGIITVTSTQEQYEQRKSGRPSLFQTKGICIEKKPYGKLL